VTSLHEFDSLLISHQVDESDNALYNSLAEGFRSLGESRVNKASSSSLDATGAATADDEEEKVVNGNECNETGGPSAKTQKQLKYSATVNFIDPTTKMVTVASSPKSSSSVATSFTTKSTNMLQQQSILHRRDSDSSTSSNSSPPTVENVYENLTSIFEHDYGSTLRSVQYKNIRTGETNIIRSLPVRPVITRHGSIGGTVSSGGTQNTMPWGGTVSTAILPVSDSSEWHTGPFCHVYIAACESTVHYRTKIRPSLRAFVSQLESTHSNTSGNQQGGHSADYLIVYIPTGDGRAIATKKHTKESSANNSTTNKNNNTSGFFQKARQRFGGNSASQSQIDDDDVNSKDSMDSCDDVVDITGNPSLDGDDVDSGSISTMMTLQHLSRNERALYKKISLDFPNGKVCVLSTTSLNDGSSDSEGGLAIRVQEWNAFNRILGIVIVNGFQDRCRRYKDELKRLDAQRATAATAAKNYESGGNISNKPQRRNPYSFNISHFFLVKESLASSYGCSYQRRPYSNTMSSDCTCLTCLTRKRVKLEEHEENQRLSLETIHHRIWQSSLTLATS